MTNKLLSATAWAVYLLLVLAYIMISGCDNLWNWIETANPSALFLSGLVGFPMLFGFVTYFLVSRYLSHPLLTIPVVPIISAIGTCIYTSITYNGPSDKIGMSPYFLKLVEAVCVFFWSRIGISV